MSLSHRRTAGWGPSKGVCVCVMGGGVAGEGGGLAKCLEFSSA